MFRYISERVNELDTRRSEMTERIEVLKGRNDIPVDEIDCHLTMWEELSFEDKRRVTDILIRVIYITSERLIIQWRI